jgi:16S rRNA (cytosine1402-N4)-methyltransferase
MTFPHLSVLKQACVKCFEGLKLHTFVDCTLGAGGHAEAILAAHPEIVTFIGIDQDPDGLYLASQRLAPWQAKLQMVKGNFAQLGVYLKNLDIQKVDGILIDLGVSSMQLDRPEKGFSFMRDGPLDMRMDPEGAVTAADIVNTWEEAELARIFRDYGEEKQWRKAAHAIVKARQSKPFSTTRDLVDVLHPVLYRFSKKGIHPLTLVFQALRICVNRELDVVEEILPQAVDCLTTGGRLAVITFHSLEDRLVKHTFQNYASDKWDTAGLGGIFLDKEPVVDLVSRKPITADEDEVKSNPRSRSAKLRIVQKR